MAACYITIFLGVFCYSNPYGILFLSSFILILIVNAIFIIKITWEIAKIYFSKSTMEKISKFIVKYFPKLKKFLKIEEP